MKRLIDWYLREWIPTRWQPVSKDKVEQEMEALGSYVGVPSRIISVRPRQPVRMDNKTYREYLLRVGPKVKEVMQTVVNRPSYRNQRKERQVKILDQMVSRVRDRELRRQKVLMRRAGF